MKQNITGSQPGIGLGLVLDLQGLQRQREENGFRDALAKACASMGQTAREGRASKGERGLIEALEAEVFSGLNTAITAEVNRRGPPKPWRSAAIEIDSNILARLAIRGFAGIVSASPAPNLKTVLRNMGHSMVLALSLAREDYEGALARQESVGQLRRAEVSKIRKKLRADQKATSDDVDTWTPLDLCKMGTLLWDTLVSCGLVRAEEVGGKKVKKKDAAATHLCAIPSERGLEVWESVKDTRAFQASVAPTLRPMLAAPRDWTGFKGGGYLTRVGSTALVRSASPVVRAAIAKATKPIKKPEFLKALNALQAVPLRINKDALWLREYVWDNGIHIQGQTPNRTKVSVPDFPTEEDGHDRSTLYRLRAERRKRINANRSIGSLEQQWRIDSAEAIELHKLHETEGLPFYLPHGMDYRGRIYATPSFSHQRGDQVKGLFEFFNGSPLGQHGLDGLKIQVANTCDFNKISKESFKERIAWVDDHMDMLEAMVDDPERFRVWARPDCDAPFSFFAAACDLVRAVRSGSPEDYVSHIRVDLDGSNSGVQHYAAATRALEGVFVSLYPALKPQDLYNIIAKRVMVAVLQDSSGLTTAQSADPARTVHETKERLKEIARLKKAEDRPYEDFEKVEIEHLKKLRDRACAAQWASYGVSRSTVKRSVMTYSYSSEAYGFGQHINEDLMEPLARDVMHGRLASHPFGADEGFAAASYLGRKVFAAVEEVLPNVAQAMRWLKSVGATQGKAGKPLRMTTRDGFPLTFEVHEQEEIRVNVLVLLDIDTPQRFQGCFPKDAKQLAPGKMSSGAAPQVIHACDATHLRMVVSGLLEEGITDFQTIHDSFGVHAANWRTLSHVCKEQMVWLYADWSPFTAMEGYEGAPFKLAKPGGLDLKKVLRSEYAFS